MTEPATNRSFVRLSGVGHRFDPNPAIPPAVTGIDLDIRRHEFVAVVGPSGCGKSTLLRMIAGLLTPSEGEVSVFGKQVSGPRDDVGIVFQKPTLLPWLTVRKNVLFPLKHKFGRYGRDDEKRADELLAMAGLESILLMDEPFSALDAMTREQIGFDLLKIWQENPKTVLFITHSIAEAVLLADRVLVMSKRPGTVLEMVDVDLPRPRTTHTISDPRFGQLTERLRKHIYEPEA